MAAKIVDPKNKQAVPRHRGIIADVARISDHRKPVQKKLSPVEAMVSQIEGAARNGSTEPLRNFHIWCQKRDINADNFIGEARENELTQMAIKMGKRIKQISGLPMIAAIEAQTMNSPAPLKAFLDGINEEDRGSSEIRKMIYPAEKALEAFSL